MDEKFELDDLIPTTPRTFTPPAFTRDDLVPLLEALWVFAGDQNLALAWRELKARDNDDLDVGPSLKQVEYEQMIDLQDYFKRELLKQLRDGELHASGIEEGKFEPIVPHPQWFVGAILNIDQNAITAHGTTLSGVTVSHRSQLGHEAGWLPSDAKQSLVGTQPEKPVAMVDSQRPQVDPSLLVFRPPSSAESENLPRATSAAGTSQVIGGNGFCAPTSKRKTGQSKGVAGNRRGPEAATRNRVIREMKQHIADRVFTAETLGKEKEVLLEKRYKVSRDTARSARRAVLSEFSVE